MQIIKNEDLSFKKVMFSMMVIMLVWAVFLYPFYYFVFPSDMSESLKNFIGVTREYIRMLPAVYFFACYKDFLRINFSELFSLKFNYKIFFLIFVSFLIYFVGATYLKNGRIYFDTSKMGFYDVVQWISLGICQEFVFRGWSYHSFSRVVSKKNAIILSSFFFAASHWFAYFWTFYMTGTFDIFKFLRVTVFTFIFGVGMCQLPLKTEEKSIMPCIILHSLWDFLASCI